MRPTAVESCFEVACWFLDRALSDGEYLQPPKLHRLMYLAQAYYGVVQHGAKLMPATFIAMEEGPIEPTVYRAFARGRPQVDLKAIDEPARHLLDSIWRQFGSHSIDRLNTLVKGHAPFADAFAAAPGAEIGIDAMIDFYGEQKTTARGKTARDDAPSAGKVMRPKVLRNATGKPVSVRGWTPKRAG